MRFTVIPDVTIPRRRALAIIASIALLFAAASTVAVPATMQSALVGRYDGSQMELAAALELTADGRFHYALSYGALDEEAAGRWALAGDRVLLTSDPVVAPRFVLVEQAKGAAGLLRVSLDLPKGLSRQYFDAVITTRNGDTRRAQLSEDGLSQPFAGDNPPTSVRLLFRVFGVVGEPVRLEPSSGYSIRLRFEPNDLGKVNFRATPLTIADGALLLERHGRTISFKHSRP